MTTLDARLAAAGVDADAEPLDAWRQLHAYGGATVVDLYDLVARERGMQGHELPVDERHALARSVMPEIWPGWTVTPGSTRSGDLIRIVEPDPEWSARFRRWRTRIATALGTAAVRIEHVGSTSVPGLPAKPIVDVQVSVADPDDEAAYVPALEAIGLQLRSRDQEHRYFRPFPDHPRDVHTHVCAVGSDWETEHLLFRDHLRTHPDARRRYAAAKREAVALWADDGIAFTEAKTAIITALLAEARARRPTP